MSDLLGLVLAGGRGRRMGGRKEGVAVPGGTLLSRAWNAVAPTAGQVLLQGCGEAPPGMQASPDLRPDTGPLAGLETGLLQARDVDSPGVVVLAVDLPRVTAPILLALVARWRALPDPGERAVTVRTRRGLQPLVGVYGTDLGPLSSRWIDDGRSPAVREWVESLGDRVVVVPEAELAPIAGHREPFLNVNRPGHVERALELPAPAPPLVSVSGWKDAGKTTVAVELTGELRERGYRVMALKHGHGFRVDAPGTDSHRLRHEGGAERVLLAGPDEMALLGGWGGAGEPRVAALAARYLHDADLVVVEGWKRELLPAVEVLGPRSPGRDPLWGAGAPDRDRFLARVAREPSWAEDSPGSPPVLRGEGSGRASRLADLVERRVIPGVRWVRTVPESV